MGKSSLLWDTDFEKRMMIGPKVNQPFEIKPILKFIFCTTAICLAILKFQACLRAFIW